MRHRLVYLFIVLSFNSLFAQSPTNLVPNPSFETIQSCPTGFFQLGNATPWFSASTTTSPNLFNSCFNGVVGVPYNAYGYQLANTGQGYAGFFAYVGGYDLIDFRQYLEVKLDSALQPGHTYCLTYFLSLPDTFGLAIGSFGAYFSTDSLILNDNSSPYPAIYPQILQDSTNFVTTKGMWTPQNGSYVAKGGEQFLTIGNFYSDKYTLLDSVGGASVFPQNYETSYYYIDDVNLIDCFSGTGIQPIEPSINVNVFPSPATSNLSVTISGSEMDYQIELIDLLGHSWLTTEAKTGTTVLPLVNLSAGIYIVQVQSKFSKSTLRRKVLISE